ncbi:MAG: Omp28-related outer membrane protein [Prevotellaceae bacterium]|jgi:hypothetical protein|nr:Omp28-related outer membrane protein [Prevotellaceae bacterium]
MKSLTKVLFVSLVVLFVASCNDKKVDPPLDEDTSLVVAYCSNEVAGFLGTSATGTATFSAAIQLPDTMLLNRGKKIVAIRVGINVPAGTSAEVFISESLSGTPLVTQQFVTKGTVWEYAKLNTPFTIPKGKELYIGYNVVGSGSVIGYNVGNAKNAKADFVAVNGNWSNLAGNSIVTKGHSLVQAFVIGNDYKDYPQYDIELSDVKYDEYLETGSDNIIKGVVTNYGVHKVAAGIKVTYSDGTNTQSVTIEQPFMNGQAAPFELLITPSTAVDVTFTITAEPVNVINNGNSNKLEGSQIFYGSSFPRTLLFEEFTTAVCVNCPAGATTVHNAMAGNEDRIAFIAQHVGYYEDTYTIAASRSLMPFYNKGGSTYAPAMMVDRRIMPEIEENTPVFFPSSSYVNVTETNKWLQIPAFVSVNLNSTYDPATRELSVDVSGEFLWAYPNAKLNVWLTQDNIVGWQSGGGNNYVHNGVARAVLSSGNWGDVIPNIVGTYSKSYTYTIPDSIMGIATSGGQTQANIPCLPENMKVVAFVADAVGTPNSSNIKKFEVRNAAFKKIIE